MADKKISQLTAATTPLAGTEVLPIVQSGSTVKVAVSNLTDGLSTVPVTKGGTGATTLTGYVKGNATAAMTATSTIPNTDVSGLGTMSTQNANNVTITGGTTVLTSTGSGSYNSNVTYSGIFIGGGGTSTILDMSVVLTDATYPQFAYVAISSGAGVHGALVVVTRTNTTYTVATVINASTSGSVSYSMSGSNLQLTNSTGGGNSFYTRYTRVLDLV